jgi:CheY-like chemotaxis protein
MAGSPPGNSIASEDSEAKRPPIVLIVEDEILIRMDIGDELRDAGWTVFEAASGDAAIELLRSPILLDLVLTDVRMPGSCNGIALAEFVRRERPGVRVAVMSGDYVPNWQQRNLFDAFFPKPVITELVAKRLLGLIKGTESR